MQKTTVHLVCKTLAEKQIDFCEVEAENSRSSNIDFS